MLLIGHERMEDVPVILKPQEIVTELLSDRSSLLKDVKSLGNESRSGEKLLIEASKQITKEHACTLTNYSR
uniref:Uncharacterized protein n=1 Tax=Ascaris lumbricoides TaxID=6252 RepID=A0A0M3HPR6_ASCLU